MQTHLAAQQQITDKKMDVILEKLTCNPSPRRHDSSSFCPYPRTRSLTKSNIPRSKSGSDLHSGYVAKDHTSQVPPMHQDLLIPLTNSPQLPLNQNNKSITVYQFSNKPWPQACLN